MSKPVTLTDDNFDSEVLSSNIPVLVDFWAEWCGPCKMVEPIVEELANEYAGKVKFGKLNVDNNHKVAGEYGIRSIPSLFIFKNGERVNQLIGVKPKNEIKSALDAAL